MSWLYFAVVQLVSLLATVFGWLLLIPFSALQLWIAKPSPNFPGRTIATWRGGAIMTPWNNPEDGVIGPDWHMPGKDIRLRAYFWSAWRNSADGLKYLFRWNGGPFYRKEWRRWYVHFGWNTSGLPVLSVGSV